MKKGVFCISIDTELLWGRTTHLPAFTKDAVKARIITKRLLILFQKYRIPATWALVGELFNPGDPLYHAPDIVEAIRKSENQEIACHSFSHADFSRISATEAEKEIKQCLTIAQKNKIELDSFVFPFNKINHLKILKAAGFSGYRGPDHSWFDSWPKFFQILDFLLLSTPPIYSIAKDKSGLINIPASMYFVSARGPRKFIPQNLRFLKARRGLEAAAAKGMLFHLWLHEIDLARKTAALFNELEKIIKYAVQLKDRGKIEIKSMGQIGG